MTRAVRRLLVISPHFPPDTSAGAHRARVIVPYLEGCGWEPTVLTVDPEGYECALDTDLAARVPACVRVERVPIRPAAQTRRLGVGDLGLRAAVPLYRAARRMRADAIYLTTYPLYPALFGPRLARALGAPLIIDLQDPWVGEWGRTVGPGPDGGPDLKSRASRAVARRIEAAVIPRADGLTSVSSGLLDELAARYPVIAGRPRVTLPIGIDPGDVDAIRAPGEAPPAADRDGALTLTYAGTLLPLGHEVLDAVLGALGDVHRDGRAGSGRLTLHCVGTSNQARPDQALRVLPRAAALGVAAWVHESPARVPYFEALGALARSTMVLVMGTTESRYTASKVQSALAVGRPLIAVVHRLSDVARTLAPLADRDPAIALFTYTDEHRAASLRPAIAALLARWCAHLPGRLDDTRFAPGSTGPELARVLADLLNGLEPRRG